MLYNDVDDNEDGDGDDNDGDDDDGGGCDDFGGRCGRARVCDCGAKRQNRLVRFARSLARPSVRSLARSPRSLTRRGRRPGACSLKATKALRSARCAAPRARARSRRLQLARPSVAAAAAACDRLVWRYAPRCESQTSK